MIRMKGDIFSVVEFLHVKPGKGNAFVRTKLKSMTTGSVIDHTFPAGHRLDTVRVERRPYQYLYSDGQMLYFMNQETFEQIPIEPKAVENRDFLQENAIVEVLFDADNENVLEVDLPKTVDMEVTYTEPGIKGDTVSNTFKPAKLESGVEIKVPLFVDIGDKVRVDTRTGEYVERVKE